MPPPPFALVTPCARAHDATGRERWVSEPFAIASVGNFYEMNGSVNSIAEIWEHQVCVLRPRDVCGWSVVL